MGKWVASWRWVASLAAKQARCRDNDNELNDDDEQDVLGLRTCRGHISLADWLIPNLAWSDDFLSTFTMQLSPGGVVGNW